MVETKKSPPTADTVTGERAMAGGHPDPQYSTNGAGGQDEKIIPFEAQTTAKHKRKLSEELVLGVMLSNPDGWRTAQELGLKAQHFQTPEYARIYTAIGKIAATGSNPDIWLVDDALERGGFHDAALLVDELLANAPTTLVEPLTDHVTNILRGQRALALRNLAAEALKLADRGNADGAQVLMNRRLAEIASTYEAVNGTKAKVWTLAELYAAEFPPTFWAVPDLVSAGLNVLAGHPKIGKSFFALQIAHASATGGKLFGLDVSKMRVLFIALEDNEGRIQERARSQQIPASATLDFVFDWPLLAQGGTERLIRAFDDYDMVIGDTLGRMLGVADRMDYSVMTAAVAPIQKAARQANRAMLFLDHHGKLTTLAASGYADPVQDILGSTGLAGVVDTAVGLYKQRGKDQKLLASAGRDTKGLNLVLEFDPLTLAWQSLGDAKDVAQTELRQEIIDAIAGLVEAETPPTAEEIAKLTNRQRPNIVRELAQLVTDRRLIKGAKVGKKQPYYILGGAPIPDYDNDMPTF